MDNYNDNSGRKVSKKQAIESLIKEVHDCRNNPDSYYADGGHRPYEKDISNACEFLKSIANSLTYFPEMTETGDGDIGFIWRNDDFTLRVSFHEEDIVFFMLEADGSSLGNDMKYSPKNFPPELQSMLGQLGAQYKFNDENENEGKEHNVRG